MSNLSQAIDNSKKMTSLLLELEESLKYEKCKYHLLKDENCWPQKMYFLYEIDGQKQLLYGNIARLKSFINLKKINTSDIYTTISIESLD